MTNLAQNGLENLKSTINEIEDDINQKVKTINHIVEYERSRSNIRISFVMLFISSLTLYLIIYPDKAEFVNMLILDAYRAIIEYLL